MSTDYNNYGVEPVIQSSVAAGWIHHKHAIRRPEAPGEERCGRSTPRSSTMIDEDMRLSEASAHRASAAGSP